MKPLCIDLFCGLGGWTDGFIAEGYDCVGFDIERHDYGSGGYPGQLVLQDVRTIHGSQFKDAAIIVASPPCQAYSYMAMPWSRAKAMAAEIDNDYVKYSKLNELFFECFRIQMEANEASGRYIPLIVENVVGAQRWVGRANWHYGSFYLWGDVPALMPTSRNIKNSGGSWYNIAHNTTSGAGNNPDGRKVSGLNWSGSDKPGYVAKAFNTTAEQGLKTVGHVNRRDGHAHTRHLTNQRESDRLTELIKNTAEGVEVSKSGHAWYREGLGQVGSKSDSRKAASAMIAKIPLALSRHIARVYKPVDYDMI